MRKYLPKEIEEKWRKRWQETKLYDFQFDPGKESFYNLVELPYTSGDLHIGHWFSFSAPDALARYKRMHGYNVFYPIGFDAFGLPAENAAIKRGVHPQEWTLSNIKTMSEQFQLMGTMIDWHHQVITCLPEYYRWNQWIFIKMFEKGVAYLDKALLNWCPVDQTVLADENIEGGRCWRCGSEVEKKEVEEWFLRITQYAEKLLWPDQPSIDWPKSVREGQNNWIGKSQGADVEFEIKGMEDKIKVFTTRIDTIFGVTFLVLAPEHPLVPKLTTDNEKLKVEEYHKATSKKNEQERKENKEKTGVFIGSFAVNPLSGEEIPIWIADYVLMGYGTGAIMAVPAADARDFEFAEKFNLPIKQVIKGKGKELPVIEEGVMINSGEYDGLGSTEARGKLISYLEEHNLGSSQIQYHLHDWSISRQRYWGTPVPIIHCERCGLVPVPLEELPVELPFNVDFTPKGKSPLESNEEWLKVSCPKCGKEARRDGQTLDGFFDNSWYFYRYLDPNFQEGPINPDLAGKLMPVDIYFGGAEHTLGHTLYSRFFTKFFQELGLIKFDEYAKRRVQHGVVLGPDGNRMSKSKGNVVNPDNEVPLYGADAIRVYLAFIGPYESVVSPWNKEGVNGSYHFLQRVWGLYDKVVETAPTDEDKAQLNKTIKRVGEDIEEIKFNTAIAGLMEWLNYLSRKDTVTREEYTTYLKLLAPFAPHITEELWQMVGHPEEGTTEGSRDSSPAAPDQNDNDPIWSIHQQPWPDVDEKYLVDQKVKIAVQVNGKVREVLEIDQEKLDQKEEIVKMAQESPKITKFLEGKEVKKSIYVKGKIVSLVV